MAHFAKLNQENIVIDVIKVNNNELLDNGIESEQKGINFLKSIFGEDTNWKQTSYNTVAGIYYTPNSNQTIIGLIPDQDQSKAFRKNYAGIDFTYDPIRNAFIPPKKYNSWILDENTCNWKPPIDLPSIRTYGNPPKDYYIDWNEDLVRWEAYDQEDPKNTFYWNTNTLSWVS
jgi:hypothetical protein